MMSSHSTDKTNLRFGAIANEMSRLSTIVVSQLSIARVNHKRGILRNLSTLDPSLLSPRRWQLLNLRISKFGTMGDRRDVRTDWVALRCWEMQDVSFGDQRYLNPVSSNWDKKEDEEEAAARV